MLLFYAQSWAMVHMLALDPEYANGFKQFLLAVSIGATSNEAMNAVYHKSLEDAGQDLRSYVGSKRMCARLFNLDVRPTTLETEEIGDAGKRVELALADVLAASPQLADEGSNRLASLATKYPEDPRPEESLGFQAMNAGRMKDAEGHFALAVKHNSENPEVWFRLAHLKLQTEGPTSEAINLLQRVVAVNPDHYGARLELGFAAAKTGQFDLAVKALEGIQQLKAEHAYSVSYTLAYCLVELEQGNKARMYAERAREFATSAKDRSEIAGLVRYINQESPIEVATRE
jgi:tetratricopeptide (TPR) repeat protein